MLSVGSTQGDFFLQDFLRSKETTFYREEEIVVPRVLNNKLLHTSVVCITLTSKDNICDVIDFCSMILKLLPNTAVQEVLINDSLIQGKADNMDYYINEVNELLSMSGLPVFCTSKFNQCEESNYLNREIVGNVTDYLDYIFSMREIYQSPFRKSSFLTRSKTSSRKISFN